jgi:superfamily II DNA or RNA helicase
MIAATQPKLELRNYQTHAIDLVNAEIAVGKRAVCLVATTGAGKTLWASECIARAAAHGQRVMLLTNRRILLSQAGRALSRHGVTHGVYAAGFPFDPSGGVQVGSIQTIAARQKRPPCDLILVDEAHSNSGGRARQIIDYYKQRHAIVLGMTATPVGLGGIYETLVEMASNSEMIKRGVLVPGTCYAPSEQDLRGVRMHKGEYVQGEAAKRVMECLVFADVFDTFKRLNDGQPAVLFAPGRQESRWFVEQFSARGIASAHIDGETSQRERDDIFGKMSDGKIRLVSSCGVLREGWDFPSVAHGLLIQACGALSTFLQIVGRIKRASPGKTSYILQDHSGAVHRHGSPDADRHWTLGDTDVEIAKRRQEACEQGRESHGIRCQECGLVREHGLACPKCGHRQAQTVRVVRTVAGELVEIVGDADHKQPEPSLRHQIAVTTGEAKSGDFWI